MLEEYNAILKNNPWTFVDLPTTRELIGCKWIFRTKQYPDGTINRDFLNAQRLLLQSLNRSL